MQDNELIGKAIDFISQAWEDESLDLEKIAAAAGFSVSYFDKLFFRQTGKTAMEFVRVYKMTRAAAMLRTSDRSVLDIALAMGYTNPENFTRAFKAVYGCAPGAYREGHRDLPMQWKDTTTGTVVKRFESAFPALERVDSDELLDHLLTTDPIRHAFRIIFTPTIDHAAYRLGEEGEYVLVEEYRPEDTALTLFCREENIAKYTGMARAFPRCILEFITDPGYSLPEDRFGFSRITAGGNYVYAGDHTETYVPEGYQVRALDREDAKLMEAFAKGENETPGRVFAQKMNHGNYGEITFLGLLREGALIGCALTCFESGRGLRYSEVGGLFLAPAHGDKENAAMLIGASIEAGLREGYPPMLLDARDDSGWLSGAMAREMGYRLESMRYVIQTE